MAFSSGPPKGETKQRSRFFLSEVQLEVADDVLTLWGASPAKDALLPKLIVTFATSELGSETRERFPQVTGDQGVFRIEGFRETTLKAPKPWPLDSTFVLDFEEPSLHEVLLGIAKTERTPRGLEQFVSKYIETKTYSRGFDIASRVAQLKSGDCTEHAVLLAALLRGAGIPARVVFGVVVALGKTGGFAAGHAWVEYVDAGKWRRLDAALFGAAHPDAAPAQKQIGIPGLSDPAAAQKDIAWLYLTTDVLAEEGPAFSRYLTARALARLVTRVDIGLKPT